MKQGGGVTRHKGVAIYVDLVVHDLSELQQEYPQTQDLFSAFARHHQGKSNFGFVELDRDSRLREALSCSLEGIELYARLHAEAPLVTISTDIVGAPGNTRDVRIVRLSEIEYDPLASLDRIARVAASSKKPDQMDFLNRIETLAEIIELKPGAFGVSVDISALIRRWIDRRRSRLAAHAAPTSQESLSSSSIERTSP